MNEHTTMNRPANHGPAARRPQRRPWHQLRQALRRQVQRLQWGPPVEVPRD